MSGWHNLPPNLLIDTSEYIDDTGLVYPRFGSGCGIRENGWARRGDYGCETESTRPSADRS
jgi:hypothetical protein